MREAAELVLALVRLHGEQEGVRRAAEQGLTQRLTFGELYEVLTADDGSEVRRPESQETEKDGAK